MSRHSGRCGKGARARAREVRMYQAYNRQRRGQQQRSGLYVDPEEMLTGTAREAVKGGHVDAGSWGTGGRP